MIYYNDLHKSTVMVIVGFGLIRLLIIKVGFQQ